MREPLPKPVGSGAYRWLYLDVSSERHTAVAIFLLGSIFSPRYSARARLGVDPLEHCAVNFALYEHGQRRAWVNSEYGGAALEPQQVRIGGSCWRWLDDGSLRVELDERTAPWGKPVRATIELRPQCPRGEEVQLVPGQPHWWRPTAPFSTATVSFTAAGVDLRFEGRGYHDENHGSCRLGEGLARWRWTRVHGPDATRVLYEPPDVEPLRVVADSRRNEVSRTTPFEPELVRDGWGLRVPQQLAPWARVTFGAPRVLEASPFYGRLEAAVDGHHALAEVADFERFHRPSIRWMARFRERVERARS